MSAGRATAEGRRVAILGIDNFSRKNRGQVTGMNERGYTFDVFTSDSLGDSAENLPPGNRLVRLERDAARRTRQLAAYLRENRRVLNHAEAYPGGRYAGPAAALARLFRVPLMTVERGDLLYHDRYDALTRLSMGLCYRLSDVVWYREIYQERVLREMGVRRLFFLANSVSVPPEVPPVEGRTLDFAWVNRLMVERRADWLADVLEEPPFAAVRVALYGFLDGRVADGGTLARQRYVEGKRQPNLEIRPYSDPAGAYREARFFLLPSEVVFCNNALLEAMSHGVVPLVSDVEGARLIVDDGVDGFVFPHSPEGLRDAMTRALALAPAELARMSRAAAEKVRTRFSSERWCDTLAGEYRRLGARAPGSG